MSIHIIKSKKEKRSNKHEVVMCGAPEAVLPNGNRAIPQHYLQYNQTKESIQKIIHDIDCLPLMPIFANEDKHGLYIQVGIVGHENYERSNVIRPQKLVYGRKWRIEPDTPTSEIIQTVFLAIKKVREHEVREFLTIKDIVTGKVSTPFSTHHDLPLMVDNQDLIIEEKQLAPFCEQDLYSAARNIKFEQRTIFIGEILVRQKNIIVDIRLGELPLARKQEGGLPEFESFECSLILQDFNPSHFLYVLMDALIQHSDHWVRECFTYKNFTRFSQDNHPNNIAALSIASRPYARDMKDVEFSSTFASNNYETDASRVPSIGVGALAEKNRKILSQVKSLTGHMPKGFISENICDEAEINS